MNPMTPTQTPNGGWQWYEPQTKFALNRQSKPSAISLTLDQAAELVQQHRLKNPQFNLPTGFHQIRDDIMRYNRARLGLPPEDNIPKSNTHQPQRAAAVAGHAGKTAAGIRLVVDWLGTGLLPVPRAEAERRSAICADCPKNQTGDLWQRLDALAAEGLRKLIGIKTDMLLSTSNEALLKTCVACDCHLPLKVHAPIEHILSNTDETVMAALDPRCWIHQSDQN